MSWTLIKTLKQRSIKKCNKKQKQTKIPKWIKKLFYVLGGVIFGKKVGWIRLLIPILLNQLHWNAFLNASEDIIIDLCFNQWVE